MEENYGNVPKSALEQDIESKQLLIKSTIIDGGYDKNLFFQYCMSVKKEGADDLKNWTKDELTNVIQQFINQQNANNYNAQLREQEYQQQKLLTQNLQLNIGEINRQREEQIRNPSIINVDIPCSYLQKSFLNDKKINVQVRNPRPVETGLFSSNYVVYEIATNIINENINLSAERRYSDFLTLRSVLKKLFPNLVIPPLPGKKMGGRRFELDFVAKRMHFLNEFLKDLVNVEEFKASEALVAFLTCDREKFDMKMKELSNYNSPLYLEEVKTLNGKAHISLGENLNDQYFDNIKSYFKLQSQLMQKLNEDLKVFYKTMNTAVVSLENVTKDFELLHSLNNQVKMKEDIVKTFEEFFVFFKNWKNIMFNQNDVIKKYVKNFFKYVQMEGDSYLDLMTWREEAKAKFDKENNKLQAKKDKLWSQMDISKWEITDYSRIDRVALVRDKQYACAMMCTVETNVCKNLLNQLGYANRCNIDELKRLIQKDVNTFPDNIKIFANNLYPTLTDALNVWTQMASAVEA